MAFTPFSAKKRRNILQIISELLPVGEGVFHWCTPPLKCTWISSSFYCWLQYMWVNPIVKVVESSSCGWPLPRINPWIIYLQSSWLSWVAAFVWCMIWLATMGTRMEIKTLSFEMIGSLTMIKFKFVCNLSLCAFLFVGSFILCALMSIYKC